MFKIFALVYLCQFFGVSAFYTDINGNVLTAANADNLDINWSLISKIHFILSNIEFNDTRYNGIAYETVAASCYAALLKTWVDVNGTIPASVVDQPAIAVTVKFFNYSAHLKTWACLQDYNSGTAASTSSTADQIMWRRVTTNVTFNNFYVMDGVPYISNNGFPTNPPSFNNKISFDGSSNSAFSVSQILFATGNLTDMIVFQTDQTIRQMTTNALANCISTAAAAVPFPDPTKCLPRYYPLATNPAVQGANGNQISVITGNDISNNPFKRRAPGILKNVFCKY